MGSWESLTPHSTPLLTCPHLAHPNLPRQGSRALGVNQASRKPHPSPAPHELGAWLTWEVDPPRKASVVNMSVNRFLDSSPQNSLGPSPQTGWDTSQVLSSCSLHPSDPGQPAWAHPCSAWQSYLAAFCVVITEVNLAPGTPEPSPWAE